MASRRLRASIVDAVSRGDHARSTGLSLIFRSSLQESLQATAVSGLFDRGQVAHILELPRQNITDSRHFGRIARGARLGVDRGAGVQRVGQLAVALGAPQAGARRAGPSVGE